MEIRRATGEDAATIHAIINDAAEAYRGVIPAEHWHEPYMPLDELAEEIRRGVELWVAEEGGEVVGVMGMEDRGDVALVRHAYVPTRMQHRGIGKRLLKHLEGLTSKPVLIGTWEDATWAIDFYRGNGYSLIPDPERERLLRAYWAIPEAQVHCSVVLARAPSSGA
ncbi:MAG TPA: GNAT family N-acetyltransferase [Longimicrobium sp.]|jgi:N-acetylglutamate synthase-like GNAT family acetyltransferase